MIKEAYCSFEVSKLLKEKGFNESIRCWYDNFQNFHEEGVKMTNTDCLPPTIMCPTQTMAMAYLREVHHLEIYPSHDAFQENCNWWFSINKFTKGYSDCLYESDSIYSTYEEACEAAIRYCLENLI